MTNLLKLVIDTIKSHKVLYTFFIITIFFNICCAYQLYSDIPLIRDGAMAKTIDANSDIWFYRSEDAMILRHEILIFVSLLSVFLGVWLMYKRIEFAFFIQLLPILIILLGN